MEHPISTHNPKRILLLINPRARKGSVDATEVREALLAAGHELITISPESDFKELILKHQNEADLVVLGGGDGTINYVLPVLVKSKLPLIVFPMGTANLLARSFEITPDIPELINLIQEGVSVPIDLGMVNGIYFINVCGLGISTEVNRRISSKLKRLTGPLSFWIMGLKIIRRLRPFKIKLTIDDQEPLITRTWQITICNGRKYAAWMTIQPDASYDDGKLRCLSTEVKEWWHGLKLLPSYIRGTYRDDQNVNFLSGRKIRLETKRPLSIDVDGDVQTKTPAVFEVKSKVLNLMLPKKALVSDEAPIRNPT